jgi:hypothetical protein
MKLAADVNHMVIRPSYRAQELGQLQAICQHHGQRGKQGISPGIWGRCALLISGLYGLFI